jgi:hypothetical protein
VKGVEAFEPNTWQESHRLPLPNPETLKHHPAVLGHPLVFSTRNLPPEIKLLPSGCDTYSRCLLLGFHLAIFSLSAFACLPLPTIYLFYLILL